MPYHAVRGMIRHFCLGVGENDEKENDTVYFVFVQRGGFDDLGAAVLEYGRLC